ncbi:hypothetical protein LJE08_12530 [Holdemanella sp. DFI.5.55]|uniref:hypothetical protein n=1 Tax=Holdemanella sp. DFI.5.55 TaxID=2885263 RepID=UPI001D0A4268|nr:hypothetical protein [Holdemanella sp. DFI.5.55]MCB8642388.1 hypothetical protein [Holdemanella sp. DFI.5.55]MCG5650750.1 hypothetical protein [Holdemanella sp. DFI.5.21]
MVNIQIGLDGVPSLRKVTIGNKYENQDEIISFTLPSEFDNFDKYVISVIKINGQKYTSILPIINNQLIVSTQLTQYAGKWSMYLMAREKTSLDLNTTPVDISAKDNERIFISDGFIGVVSDSEIEKENIGALTLDANLQIIYDDLAKLRDEIVERMKTPLSYTQLIDVPTEFNPAPHDHDARYHTKEEMDLKLVNKADVEHSHDDLYYTKLKTDDLLKSKSDVTHNHNESYYGKSEVDDLLSAKANNEHSHDDLYYGKLETDKLLENKSGIAHQHDDRYYTEDEIDAKLSLKAETEHNHNDLYYAKLVTDKLLESKADTMHVHDDRYNTKDEATVLLTSKADVDHTHEIVDITDFPTSLPANGGNADTVNNHTVLSNVPASAQFTDTVYVHPETHPASMITGLPTKVSELENDKKYQTANEVAKAISDLVKLAPDTLNTLEELANALGNDPHFATTIMTMLGEKASKADLTTKVDVVAGKMLSSNDFTNELKTKLESLSNYDDSKLKALITSNQSALNTELAKKVTQIEGKQLSTNDYSTAEKNKLASLNNYDDSAIVKQLKELSDRVNGISMSIAALSVTDGVLKMSVDVQEGGKQ